MGSWGLSLGCLKRTNQEKKTSYETKGRETEEDETKRRPRGVRPRATQTSLPRQPRSGTWASMGTSF